MISARYQGNIFIFIYFNLMHKKKKWINKNYIDKKIRKTQPNY